MRNSLDDTTVRLQIKISNDLLSCKVLIIRFEACVIGDTTCVAGKYIGGPSMFWKPSCMFSLEVDHCILHVRKLLE